MFVRDRTLSSVGFRLFLTGRRSHAELMVSPVSTQRHGVQLLILLLGSDGGATTGSGREMPTLGKWGVFWGGEQRWRHGPRTSSAPSLLSAPGTFPFVLI